MTTTRISSTIGAAEVSRAQLWTGRVLWFLTVPFLIMDAGMHIAKPAPVLEACQKLQFPVGAMTWLGLVQLVCLALYLIPRTAVLGGVLLTGYLGGAVATHVRVGDPLWFPILLGALLWISLYCRDARVRALISPSK